MSLAQPIEFWSFVFSAMLLMICPIKRIPFILSPLCVVAILTEPQTDFVLDNTSGRLFIVTKSLRVKPLWIKEENPPIKSIPIFLATLSKVRAISMQESSASCEIFISFSMDSLLEGLLQALIILGFISCISSKFPNSKEIGVIVILLLIIGTP